MNVSAYMARQKATGHVVDKVSDHMGGDEPTLVVEADRFLWRVPVQLAVLPYGRLGHVGTVDVDAHSGELQITDSLVEEFRRNALALVRPST
jgi:hypothetical protein